ncbi:hypothetical protein NG744_05765 [Aliarcobacter cryaerophilus]|uniref:hypothetical protein n=1 Tax=Aliarcobacter cryaerophilus TaxID=28198 RepID=UPI003DA28ABB
MSNQEINDKQLALVWEYFKLHAEQRLKTFHFYIIIITLLVGSALTILKDKEYTFFIFIGILMSFFSFIFWRLDIRNKELINMAEEEIITLEKEFDAKVFTKDKEKVNNKKLNLGFSFNFNLVFLLFNFIGYSMVFITLFIIKFEYLDTFINILSLILYSYIILINIFLLFKSKHPFIDANSGLIALVYLFLMTR